MAAIDTAQIAISADFNATLARASELAAGTGATELGLEHLLTALCDDPDAMALFSRSAVAISDLKADLSGRLASGEPSESRPAGSLGVSDHVRRVLEAASAAAKGSRRRDINGAIVVAAIVGDARNPGAEILQTHGLTFEAAIQALQSTLASAKTSPPRPVGATAPVAAAPSPSRVEKDVEAPPLETGRPLTPAEAVGTLESVAMPVSNKPAAMDPPAEKNAAESYSHTVPAGKTDLSPERDAPAAPAPSKNSTSPPAPASRPVPSPQPAPVFQPTLAPAAAPVPAYPSAPFQGYPAAPRSPEPSLPYPGQPGFSSSGPRKEGAGYGLPPARPSLPPGIGAASSLGSTDILANIARGRPRPVGVQPPPIPPAIAVPPGSYARGRGPAPSVSPTLQPTLRQETQFPSAPAPASVAPARPVTAGKRRIAKVEPGQLAENIPRSMRVGRTERAEVRIAKASVKALTEGLEGEGPAWQHTVSVTKAMAVRMRAPEGGFFIESASPETQWIENSLGYASDDFASWRFLITPQSRGWSRLQIVVSARTSGADGVAAETALPDQVIEVKVRRNIARSLARLAGWTIAAVIGGALATFGEMGIEFAKTYAQKFMH